MDKPLQVAFKNMETSVALETLIRQRVDRLERLSDRIVSCRVVVEVPHRSAASAKVPLAIAIEVEMPGRRKLIAKNEDDRRDFKDNDTAFVTKTFEAIERQIRAAAAVSIERQRVDEPGDVTTGVIVRLFPDQNYGFVEIRQSPELYFTRNAVAHGKFDELEVGTMVYVTVATTEGPMGPQASSVQVVQGVRSPE